MTIGDTVYINLPRGRLKTVTQCRATIQEINGGVARIQAWDGKSIFTTTVMLKQLSLTPNK